MAEETKPLKIDPEQFTYKGLVKRELDPDTGGGKVGSKIVKEMNKGFKP